MLTDKGRYILDLIQNGIQRSWSDYEDMWLNAHDRPKTVKKICPTCKQPLPIGDMKG